MITIGFTYDLRDDYIKQGFSAEDSAEFDSVETITSITNALEANGFLVKKIGNVRALVEALAAGQRWDIVFNICEGVKGIGREAQVPALLEAYGIPYVFSPSDVMVVTMDKALAKMVVREQGIPTAPFAVISTLEDVDTVDLSFPVFAKPLAEGTGKGISAKSWIADKNALKRVCAELIQSFSQPVLVESYLPGRDLTVGIVGQGNSARVIGVMESLFKEGAEQGGQSFYNKENCEQVMEYVLVNDLTAKNAGEYALQSWQALRCLDAGRVDLRCDQEGVPNFLEVNPMAGLHPTHSDLPILSSMAGIDHTTLIGLIMDEACYRHGINRVNHSSKESLKHESCDYS